MASAIYKCSMFVIIQNGKSYQKLIFTLNGFNKDETRAEYDFFEGNTVGFPCVVHVLSVCFFYVESDLLLKEAAGRDTFVFGLWSRPVVSI